jgi:hypothetical protein
MAPAAAEQHKGFRYEQVPQGAYSIVAQVRAKPGKEDELRRATLPLVALVRSDPKNLVYFLQEDREATGGPAMETFTCAATRRRAPPARRSTCAC